MTTEKPKNPTVHTRQVGCFAFSDYKESTPPRTVTERNALKFQIVCDKDLTPYFIRSLQRALALRGLYRGPIHGKYDERTLQAVQLYQSRIGIDSGRLSLKAAHRLALVALRAKQGWR